MFKKAMALLLTAVMLLSFASCTGGNGGGKDTGTGSENETTTPEATTPRGDHPRKHGLEHRSGRFFI